MKGAWILRDMRSEREAFEDWVRESGSFTDWSRDRASNGPYHKPLVERTWQAWQAAVQWTRAKDKASV